MYYYDPEDGKMKWTVDDETAGRSHIAVMVGARQYPLQPQAVGQLQRFLGPAPNPEATEAQIKRRVDAALQTLGLGEVPLRVALNSLGDEWRAAIEVGSAAAPDSPSRDV